MKNLLDRLVPEKLVGQIINLDTVPVPAEKSHNNYEIIVAGFDEKLEGALRIVIINKCKDKDFAKYYDNIKNYVNSLKQNEIVENVFRFNLCWPEPTIEKAFYESFYGEGRNAIASFIIQNPLMINEDDFVYHFGLAHFPYFNFKEFTQVVKEKLLEVFKAQCGSDLAREHKIAKIQNAINEEKERANAAYEKVIELQKEVRGLKADVRTHLHNLDELKAVYADAVKNNQDLIDETDLEPEL